MSRAGFRLLLLALVPVILLAAIGCSLDTADAPAEQPPDAAASPTPEGQAAGPELPVINETPAPVASPTPARLPDRTTCDEIRGTEYRSPEERTWYLANCVPTPEPTPDVPAPNPPPIPGPEVAGERWVLVDLGTQTATAMIGNEPLYTALVTTGQDGWETPVGTWNIVYRVENETMTSESIGADEYYVLEDVLYTQYFTTVGHALHLNYWRPDHYFGNTRSSHGCVGMRLADAEFFWNFATIGTRVTVQ